MIIELSDIITAIYSLNNFEPESTLLERIDPEDFLRCELKKERENNDNERFSTKSIHLQHRPDSIRLQQVFLTEAFEEYLLPEMLKMKRNKFLKIKPSNK